jgi:hypothetical protein
VRALEEDTQQKDLMDATFVHPSATISLSRLWLRATSGEDCAQLLTP